MTDNTTITFTDFRSPEGRTVPIPSDIRLATPTESRLAPERLRNLVYIPWDESYLSDVPSEYLAFFTAVKPYLGVRTTDVHVAHCMQFIQELLRNTNQPVDERVVTIAFILHDIGWSQLAEEEIASSLDVKGLALSSDALAPKEKHAVLGAQLAREILEKYQFDQPLSEEQKELICQAVLYHDKPWELAADHKVPIEVQLVCDVDHLWSFTHQNFWQDTVRKNVAPSEYLKQLAHDLDGYFLTEQGKSKARELLSDRRAEAALLGNR